MKIILALLLAFCLTLGIFAGCGTTNDAAATTANAETTAPAETEPQADATASAPKYVFLFIGDGMSYPQIQSTADYLGALNDEDYFLAQPSLNDKGFFMMCEGGKIDWACHANDAASSIQDAVALTDAVQIAIGFADEHPEETLISMWLRRSSTRSSAPLVWSAWVPSRRCVQEYC